MLYVEHRSTVSRVGKPRFIPITSLSQYVGFRSVYAYDQATVDDLVKKGHTRELKAYDVYSDCLLLDFDDCLDEAAACETWLMDQAIHFDKYHSGNRSIHFHVKIEPMHGKHVPIQQKIFVRQTFAKADVSFYHAGGMFRLVGTYHHKNPGHCKTFLYCHAGVALKIPEMAAASYSGTPIFNGGEVRDLGLVLASLVQCSAYEGNRRPHMYKIISTSFNLGYSYEEAMTEIMQWNEHYASPKHSLAVILPWSTEIWQRLGGLPDGL